MKIRNLKTTFRFFKRYLFIALCFLMAYPTYSQLPQININQAYHVTIFENETIAGNVYISNQSIVDIRGTVKMKTGAKILIMPGSVLRIANGAVLTHEDDDGTNTKDLEETWAGIEVRGKSFYGSEQQDDAFKLCKYPVSDCIGSVTSISNDDLVNESECLSEYQLDYNNGIVLMDYGTIKYADCGIFIWQGGLLNANNSEFTNCKKSSIYFVESPANPPLTNIFREFSRIWNSRFYTRLNVNNEYIIDNMIHMYNRNFYYPITVEVENLTENPLHYDVKIYGFHGSLIAEEALTIEASRAETASFSTAGIPPGYYIVRGKDEVVNFKFIVE